MNKELEKDAEFLGIARSIVHQHLSLGQWAAVESSDMFQSEHYCGGFDATEEAFTFSLYDHDGGEWWFQCSLPEIESLVQGRPLHVQLRRPG